MAAFRAMVDMTLSEAEKEEQVEEMQPSVHRIPDVPYGLRICLTEVEIEKLGLIAEDGDHDLPEVGEVINLVCVAEVTSVSSNSDDRGKHCRIELSIISMMAEDPPPPKETD